MERRQIKVIFWQSFANVGSKKHKPTVYFPHIVTSQYLWSSLPSFGSFEPQEIVFSG